MVPLVVVKVQHCSCCRQCCGDSTECKPLQNMLSLVSYMGCVALLAREFCGCHVCCAVLLPTVLDRSSTIRVPTGQLTASSSYSSFCSNGYFECCQHSEHMNWLPGGNRACSLSSWITLDVPSKMHFHNFVVLLVCNSAACAQLVRQHVSVLGKSGESSRNEAQVCSYGTHVGHQVAVIAVHIQHGVLKQSPFSDRSWVQ